MRASKFDSRNMSKTIAELRCLLLAKATRNKRKVNINQSLNRNNSIDGYFNGISEMVFRIVLYLAIAAVNK